MVNISKVYFLSLLLVGASGVALASPHANMVCSVALPLLARSVIGLCAADLLGIPWL